jgi:hypothetical protein
VIKHAKTNKRKEDPEKIVELRKNELLAELKHFEVRILACAEDRLDEGKGLERFCFRKFGRPKGDLSGLPKLMQHPLLERLERVDERAG